jgi:solute:Na+ symporter, SSS family
VKGLDWAVLVGTIALIVAYGASRGRGVKSSDVYIRGGNDIKWWTIGLSIVATQASAITFLSMPGQAYEDGMGFIQFYFGQPVAMVLLSAFIVPIYYKLKVYTAYEYLETRFDRKTRQLTALLFLASRGLAAGISIYAPAIVLSTVLGWSLQWTNIVIGGATILYTVSGGTRAVSRTQQYQMIVMLGGMILAAIFIWHRLPPELGLHHAVHVAGTLGKMKIVDYSPRLDTRYTFWSGMTGGLFVALAYFGTDQSQVQRYLGGASLTESRLGMMMHGLVKIPMQLLILFIGVLLFVFYQLNAPPIFFNQGEWQRVHAGPQAAEARRLDDEWATAAVERRARVESYVKALGNNEPHAIAEAETALRATAAHGEALRKEARSVIKAADPNADTKDQDYIFIGFVLAHFPPGLIGLLIAVILCAAMSATASALNSLGSTSVVDFYRPTFKRDGDDAHYLAAAKWFTVFWGVLAVLFAAFASLVDNLIQAVNILGSLFYGPMLGVFLVGFFMRGVRATPAFIATIVAEAIVLAVFAFSDIGYLWYNVIGCGAVVLVAWALNLTTPPPAPRAA